MIWYQRHTRHYSRDEPARYVGIRELSEFKVKPAPRIKYPQAARDLDEVCPEIGGAKDCFHRTSGPHDLPWDTHEIAQWFVRKTMAMNLTPPEILVLSRRQFLWFRRRYAPWSEFPCWTFGYGAADGSAAYLLSDARVVSVAEVATVHDRTRGFVGHFNLSVTDARLSDAALAEMAALLGLVVPTHKMPA